MQNKKEYIWGLLSRFAPQIINLGTTMIISIATTNIKTDTQQAVNNDHSNPLFNILRIAHTDIIGAFTIA